MEYSFYDSRYDPPEARPGYYQRKALADALEADFKRSLLDKYHPGHDTQPVEFYFLWGDQGYEAIAKNSQRYKDLQLTGKLRRMPSGLFGCKRNTSKWAGTRAIFSDGKKEIDSNGNPQTPLFQNYLALMSHGIDDRYIAQSDPNWLSAFW